MNYEEFRKVLFRFKEYELSKLQRLETQKEKKAKQEVILLEELHF